MRRISATDALDALLALGEEQVCLVQRATPKNAAAERARLIADWSAGRESAPCFAYGESPALGALVSQLSRLVEKLPEDLPHAPLYEARARELLEEAAVVESLGTPEARERARLRYRLTPGEREESDRLAREWVREVPRSDGQERISAVDAHDARSLLQQIRVLIGRLRLPVRVTTSGALLCSAATRDGEIRIRESASFDETAARRIALHEVVGHAAPRVAARTEALGFFRFASAQAADDEEGRALLLEERAGFFDRARRWELALRHLAAESVREGADFVETARLLRAHGTSVDPSITLAMRVHRGGGLAREVVYLPAWLRVRAALRERPELERWLERGRVGVRAAALLAGGAALSA